MRLLNANDWNEPKWKHDNFIQIFDILVIPWRGEESQTEKGMDGSFHLQLVRTTARDKLLFKIDDSSSVEHLTAIQVSPKALSASV